jgi:AraC-like DNA-binding protein
MQQDIKILIAVLAKLELNNSYKPHSHLFYQLNHIAEGTFEYEVEDRKYTAEVGDTILIPANFAHTFTQTRACRGYYFEVKFSALSKGFLDLFLGEVYFVKNDPLLKLLAKAIVEEKGHSTKGSEDVMVSYLWSILYRLTEKKRHDRKAVSQYIKVSDYSAPVRDVIRFLETDYKKPLTLDDIVDQTRLKKSYLCYLFKKETTVTIFECLMIIRVRQAVELLTYTPMPLAQIAKETGFVSVPHFNKVFTNHVMIPPGQFRKYMDSQELNWDDAGVERKTSPIVSATIEGKKIDFPQLKNGQAL